MRWYSYLISSATAASLLFVMTATTPADERKGGSDSPDDTAIGFLDIYNNILVTNCALSSCHDGHFEPNFTSAQAAYYTTVEHYVTKNSRDFAFRYRVEPYLPEKSMLLERLTNCCMNNKNDQMPLLLPPLSPGQIDSIEAWIAAGAPDAFGQFPYRSGGAK